MAVPSVEEITKGVHAAVVEETAIQIKRYYKAFDADGTPPTDDQAYLTMADDLISKGEFTVGTKKVIKVDAINNLRKMKEKFPQAEEEIEETIRSFEGIPDEQGVQKIGSTIHKGIEKSTSFFSGGGFLESIMNYIMGFIDWLAGGCQKSLMGCIGERFAPTTSSYVQDELKTLASNDNEVAKILTDDRIAQISVSVQDQTVRSFTGEKPTEKHDRLAATKIEESPLRGIIDETIKAEVAKFFNKDNVSTKDIDETGAGRKSLLENGKILGFYQTMSEQDMQQFKNALEKAALEVVHDKATITMDSNTIREAIASKVNAILNWSDGTESKVKEAIVMGADKKSVVDDATLGQLQAASTAYNNGVSTSTVATR